MNNQYVASPVSSPSRYNCLTGKYASRADNKQFTYFTKMQENQTVIHWNTFITDSTKILPDYLKELGYKTGFAGKNHCIEVDSLKMFEDYWADLHLPENMDKVKYNYNRTVNKILNAGFDYAGSVYHDNPNWIGLGHCFSNWVTKGQ